MLLFIFQDDGDNLSEFEEKVGISLQELREPVLSVIVPTYNEEGSIASTLKNLVQVCVPLKW